MPNSTRGITGTVLAASTSQLKNGDAASMKSVELISTPWSPSQTVAARTVRHRCRSARWKSITLVSLLSLTGLGEFASAADATDAASTDASSSTTDTGGLSEITVTAEKFTSTIQNTPIS